MALNQNPSRPGAQPFAALLTIEMNIQEGTEGGEVPFALASVPPGFVQPGQPPAISLVGLHQAVMVLVKLVGPVVAQKGMRFSPHPHQAAWFGHGGNPPQGPGSAGGMFVPLAVSSDGSELLFKAVNPGDGGEYRARFNFDTQLATALHGGPIIIND
jgi:hypothetical protein